MKVGQKSMNNNRRDWAVFVLVIVFFQLLANVTIALNIPVARQVLCFIYLTLVPGIVLLKVIDVHGLNSTEKFLFSIGLSVALVMFLGLIINQIGISFGFSVGFYIPSLLLATNFVVSFLCILCYFLNRDMPWGERKLNFSLLGVLTICLPVLAILGTALVNFSGNSVILLLMIGIIALTVLTYCVRDRTNWSLILFMITIALLLHTSLISNYIVGFDVHPAYHAFKNTQSGGRWTPIVDKTDLTIPRVNQMLSTTIFPVTYSNVLNLGGSWIFKIVYPLVFALVPVGLYQLYQKYMKKKAAALAAFFMVANTTFFAEMPGLPTQMIAEFFLVLLLIVIFHEKINSTKKMVFFAIFSTGMVVSHYGTSYLFMFILLFAWLFLFLGKKQSKIKGTYVMLFFVITFSWYIYTSQSASFTTLLRMGQDIYTSFWTEFINPEQTLREVGMGEPAVSIRHWLGRGLHYTTQFFIVLGVVSIILKWRRSYKFDREYAVISLFALIFLVLPVVVPSFNLLNIPRMHHVALLFLAPFCIVGGDLFFSVLPMRRSYMPFVLTLIVVTSLFLFETGFIYEVCGDESWSIPLSMYRIDRTILYGRGYLTECVDVFGAEWLHSNIILTESTVIYADIVSINFPLTSYAVFPRDHTEILSNVTSFDSNAYVYLRNFNTFDNKISSGMQTHVNASDIRSRLETFNKIYTNGGSEIFFVINKTGP